MQHNDAESHEVQERSAGRLARDLELYCMQHAKASRVSERHVFRILSSSYGTIDNMKLLTARSTTRKYLSLSAKAATRELMIVAERYLPGGVIERDFVPSGSARNPGEQRQIGMGPARFRKVVRDYSEWRLKWWRECVQNSVDARATLVKLGTKTREDGSVLCYCIDNGKGMSESILVDKFLMLGETTKEGEEGSTGGFGVAKELLILPWLNWSIRTRDLRASGSGAAYTLERDLPTISGTVLEVVMPAELCTSSEAAREFLQRCSLSRVSFELNDVPFTDWLHRGRKLREIDEKAEIYYNKSSSINMLLVRHSGIYMHMRWLPSGVTGTVIAELLGPSTKLLVSNRDSLNDYSLDRALSAFGNELAADTGSALKDKSKAFRKIYEGEQFRAAEDVSRVARAVGPIPAVTKDHALEISGTFLADLTQVLGDIEREIPESTTPTSTASADMAIAMLDGLRFTGAGAIEATLAQLVWKPAFYVFNEIEDWKPQKKFLPETMTPKIRALAQLWAEMCRWVLIQLGSREQYGVGFVFSESTRALYSYDKGRHWILINPFTNMVEREEVFSKTDHTDLKRMYASAIHECTHLADGVMLHDEAFSSAFTRNVAKCADGFQKVKKIAAAVRERAPRGSVAEKSPSRKKSQKPIALKFESGLHESAGGYDYAVVPMSSEKVKFRRIRMSHGAFLRLLEVSETASGVSALAVYDNGQIPSVIFILPEALDSWMRDELASGTISDPYPFRG